MTLEVLGGLAELTPAYLSMVENGKRTLDRYSLIIKLASALSVSPSELAPGLPDKPGSVTRPPAGSVSHPGQQRPRRIVEALGFIDGEGAAAAADSLVQLVDHYSHAIGTTSPATVYDELLEVRTYANGLITRSARQPWRADLAGAAGWLSNLLAIAACDLGEHATARLWCADSERRSNDTGNPELAGWALLTRALIAYYQGRSRQSVTLAARGRATVPIGTVVYAKLAAQEMRSAAQAGDLTRMTSARREASRAISKLPAGTPATGAFSIALAEDPPYTATSLLLAGNFPESVTATNRVISTVYPAEARQRGENPSGYARSLLILGLAHAGAGRLDEAVAAGHDALAGRRPAWPTMVLAGQLDQVLARNFPGARQVTAYHARYLEAASATPADRQVPRPAPPRNPS
jgi:transcriptional regulator with XRE-family HTH domain